MSENHTLSTLFGHGCVASHVVSDTPPPPPGTKYNFRKIEWDVANWLYISWQSSHAC